MEVLCFVFYETSPTTEQGIKTLHTRKNMQWRKNLVENAKEKQTTLYHPAFLFSL